MHEVDKGWNNRDIQGCVSFSEASSVCQKFGTQGRSQRTELEREQETGILVVRIDVDMSKAAAV